MLIALDQNRRPCRRNDLVANTFSIDGPVFLLEHRGAGPTLISSACDLRRWSQNVLIQGADPMRKLSRGVTIPSGAFAGPTGCTPGIFGPSPKDGSGSPRPQRVARPMVRTIQADDRANACQNLRDGRRTHRPVGGWRFYISPERIREFFRNGAAGEIGERAPSGLEI